MQSTNQEIILTEVEDPLKPSYYEGSPYLVLPEVFPLWEHTLDVVHQVGLTIVQIEGYVPDTYIPCYKLKIQFPISYKDHPLRYAGFNSLAFLERIKAICSEKKNRMNKADLQPIPEVIPVRDNPDVPDVKRMLEQFEFSVEQMALENKTSMNEVIDLSHELEDLCDGWLLDILSFAIKQYCPSDKREAGDFRIPKEILDEWKDSYSRVTGILRDKMIVIARDLENFPRGPTLKQLEAEHHLRWFEIGVNEKLNRLITALMHWNLEGDPRSRFTASSFSDKDFVKNFISAYWKSQDTRLIRGKIAKVMVGMQLLFEHRRERWEILIGINEKMKSSKRRNYIMGYHGVQKDPS
jgi:hypothetical protein